MPKKKIVNKCKHDKFYTKPSVAKECIDFLKTFTGSAIKFVEPSAGNGSFSNQLDCKAYDIEPEDNKVIKQDFFTVDIEGEDVCVVGNPPFGNRNALTKKFIKHSMGFDGVKFVAFILPECFKKQTMQAVFTPEWSLVGSRDITEGAFLLQGEEYHVPCVFQIWERNSDRHDMRERKCLAKCKHFEIVSKSKADEAQVFSFGASPAKLLNACDVKPNNRGYYLKSLIDTEELMCNIKAVDWKERGASSVSGGVFWVSSSEYIKYYCEYHKLEVTYV